MPKPEPIDEKKQAEKEVKQIAKELEIDLTSDAVIKVGDWKGPANEFRKHWLSRSSLNEMREKDKAELARQVEAEKTKLALEQQRALTEYAMRNQRPQQGNGNSLDARIGGILDKLRNDPNRQGFVDADSFNEIIGMLRDAVVAELQARDRILGQFGQGIDQFYGDYKKRSSVLDSLADSHTDKRWGSFIDALAKDYPELPRSTIELMASAYEASDGETPDQLQEAIREAVGGQVKELDTHRASIRNREREQQDAIVESGIPGVGGHARPSLPQKPLRTSDEITDHFASFDEPAA